MMGCNSKNYMWISVTIPRKPYTNQELEKRISEAVESDLSQKELTQLKESIRM